MENGVSVIICCFNSANRIKPTLLYLSRQEFTSSFPWEIVLVDNASTDVTAQLSVEYWEKIRKDIPIHVVNEPKPGQAFARITGMEKSRYSFLLFCDDDNHLTPKYIQGIYDHLEQNPKLAACGGFGIPVFEQEKPAWFDNYAEAFAIGSQKITTENRKQLNLYGAGLGIKKNIIKEIFETGFIPIMKGREGNNLSSSEDTELTYAMVIRGYDLMCDDDLTFLHYMPAARMQEKYLEKLIEASGHDGPVRNLYYSFITERFFHQQIKNWYVHSAFAVIRLVKYFVMPPKKNGRKLYLKWSVAYLKSLIRIKPDYRSLKNNIELIKKTRLPLAKTAMIQHPTFA